MIKPSLYIITGSSKGIGKALVRTLLKEEQNTIIGISRSEEKSDSAQYVPLSLDLGNFSEIEKNLDQIFPEGPFSKVVLINNAGWIGQINHLGKLEPEKINSLFNLNITAPTILINEFVKRFGNLEDVEKLVINISSGAAQKAIDGWSGYCASKAALNMLSLVAQEESKIQGSGIRYFALSPGVVDTEMQGDIRSAPGEGFTSLHKFQDLKAGNQLNSPEETALKIIYLIEHVEKFKEVLQDVREF